MDMLFYGILFILSILDIKYLRIFNPLLVILIGLWLFKVESASYLAQGLLAAFFYGSVAFLLNYFYQRVRNLPALGDGDIKLFAVLGLWLGVENFSHFLILTGFFGVLTGSLWSLFRKEERVYFPLGPALSIAAIILTS